MSNQAAARSLDGIALPAPGVWEIDPSHSSVGAVARHLMVSKVRGRFTSFAGRVTIGETPEGSAVEATIEAASIDTAEPKRDAHLRSPDFLDAARYPTLDFRSTAVKQTGPTSLSVDGDLTIRGITRPVTLEVGYGGLISDPFGNAKAIFSAQTEIDREDWGMTWNAALETGGVLVGKRLQIELEIQAVRKP
ncbi:MAG: YceI family protein [Actinomycetota bacterium]